jgi:hypothetical protein
MCAGLADMGAIHLPPVPAGMPLSPAYVYDPDWRPLWQYAAAAGCPSTTASTSPGGFSALCVASLPLPPARFPPHPSHKSLLVVEAVSTPPPPASRGMRCRAVWAVHRLVCGALCVSPGAAALHYDVALSSLPGLRNWAERDATLYAAALTRNATQQAAFLQLILAGLSGFVRSVPQ